MKPMVRNVLAVVAGLVVGSCVNMGLILVGAKVVPPPPGVDVSTVEGLKAAMPVFAPRHFLFPWLAHALGTLAGAWMGATLAASQRQPIALGIGAAFLAGGIANVLMLPSPPWFTLLDLGGAYLPMAWLGARWARPRVRGLGTN